MKKSGGSAESVGIFILEKNFEKETSLGPVLVGNFMHPNDKEARNRVIIDSFMRVNKFLELLE